MPRNRRRTLSALLVATAVAAAVSTGVTPALAAMPNVSCGTVTAADTSTAAALNRVLTGSLSNAMDSYRVSCARAIVNAVRARGMSDRAAVIAVTTAIVESTLQNNPNVLDHTSVGLFQQLDSWGSTADRLDPAWSTGAFLKEMVRIYPGNAWQSQQIGAVCQGVQRSAFPDRYQPQAADAQRIVDAISRQAPATPAQAAAPLGDRGSVIGADGNNITFTRDAGTGHLQVTYRPVSSSWATADLSGQAGTEPSAGGAPAAFVQPNGTVGAVTADAANGHLRITYKPANGAWATSDLTADFGTPVSDGKVSAIVDGSGTLAIFSRNSLNGHANLTYLPTSGSWSTFDLTNNAGTPAPGGGAPAAFLQNNGTLGVVTADAANGHLRITYKPADGPWTTSDLTSGFGAPVSDGNVSSVVDGSGTLAIFSRNSLNSHLQLTYLPTSGVWSLFDVTTQVGTPNLG